MFDELRDALRDRLNLPQSFLQRVFSLRWPTISWDHVKIEFVAENAGAVLVHQPMRHMALYTGGAMTDWKHTKVALEDFQALGQVCFRAIYHRPAQTVYVSWAKEDE